MAAGLILGLLVNVSGKEIKTPGHCSDSNDNNFRNNVGHGPGFPPPRYQVVKQQVYFTKLYQ